jgi:hypothetical protein
VNRLKEEKKFMEDKNIFSKEAEMDERHDAFNNESEDDYQSQSD